MTKYRIALQKIDRQFKHIHNIMFESDDVYADIKKIRKCLKKGIELSNVKFTRYLHDRTQRAVIRDMIESDKFDKRAVGSDITPEEFVQNEIEWYKHEE